MVQERYGLGFKGVIARWVLVHVTDEPTAEAQLLAGLEGAGLGEDFLKKEAPGYALDESLAWVIYGLEGEYKGFGPLKRRWLPVGGRYPQRRAARVILRKLPEATTTTMAELVEAARAADIAREPFSCAAAWMLKRISETTETEERLKSYIVQFWDRWKQ